MLNVYRWIGTALLLTALVLSGSSVYAQDGATLEVSEHPDLGPILTDSEGNTLYRFTNDEAGVSNCIGECADIWPPLTIEGDPTGGEGVTGQLGTISREDGSSQMTYNDMPLYLFANDAEPGEAVGQGVRDVWYVVHPDAPSVSVQDQSIEGGTAMVEQSIIAEPGWMVIHAEADGGGPGPILGQTALEPGVNSDVTVEIDTEGATETLYAMLHSDRGAIGTFEFPDGPDLPVTVGGDVVTPPFAVTGGLTQTEPEPTEEATEEATPTEEATEEATPTEEATEEATPTEEATEEATPTETLPETLPETSSESAPLTPLLAAFAVLALIGGLGLRLLWRTR